MTKNPLGIRNNNPGNIKRTRDKWQGLADEQRDATFFTFKDPVYGIRAIARLLIRYQDDYDCGTIEKVIARYAPTSENATGAYVKSVVQKTGFKPDEELDFHEYAYIKPMIEAIIYHENGKQPYTDAQIDKALVLAGVEAPKKSLGRSRTIQGAQMATAGITLSAASEVVTQASTQLQPLVQYADMAKWAFLALSFIGIALTVWARIDDRQKGIN